MKLKRFIAALGAVSILTGACFQNIVFAEDAEVSDSVSDSDSTVKKYTVTYDADGGSGRIDGDGASYEAGDKFRLSVWALEREGSSHYGWTDGKKTYKRGDTIPMPSEDLHLTAVYDELYSVGFEDFTPYEVNWPLSNRTASPGTEIYLPNYGVFYGKKMFNGWLVNDVHYDPLSTIIMPSEDIFIKVDWLDPIEFVFFAGDVDGMMTEQYLYVDKYPGTVYDLPDATKMGRLGYKLGGWIDTYDGKQYELEQRYDVPARNVTLQAVWNPITLAIRFSGGEGATGTMERAKAPCGSKYTIPECGFTREGYKLLGWKLRDEYYGPEETMRIKIASAGESPQFVAQWIEEDMNPGDLNADGTVDINDLVLLSQILLKDVEISGEEQEKNADVLRDGTVDMSDLALLQQYVMKDKVLLGLKGD